MGTESRRDTVRSGAREVRSEWSAAPVVIRALVVFQILLLVAAGVFVALEYPPWSPVDEGAHFDYIQWVAEDGRLPVLGQDRIHPEVASLGARTYPTPAPRLPGLAGESYEAFQPPLYYVLMAPVWKLASDHSQKMKLVRVMGVVFLVLTVAVLAAIARMVLGRDWPSALAFVLMVLLLPGILFRSALVGNAALDPLLGSLLVGLLIAGWRRRSYAFIVAAAGVAGLCLLNRLVLGYGLVLLGAVAVWVWWRRGRRPLELAWVALIGAIPLAMLAPWLLSNRAQYGAWTASELARQMQQYIINPTNKDYTLFTALGDVPAMTRFATAGEWGKWVEDRRWAWLAFNGVEFLVLPLGAVLLVVFGRRAVRTAGMGLCIAPLIAVMTALVVSTVLADWPQELARYTTGALPVFSIAVYAAYRVAIPRPGEWARFQVIVALGSATALVVLLWAAFGDNQFVPF